MIEKILKKRFIIATFSTLIPISVCVEGTIVNCDQQMMKDINEQVEVGFKRDWVENYLRTIEADYSYHDNNQLVLQRIKMPISLMLRLLSWLIILQ